MLQSVPDAHHRRCSHPWAPAAVAFGVRRSSSSCRRFLGSAGAHARVGFRLTMLAMLAATASSVAALALVSVGIDGACAGWSARAP
jgi:hypothetical protein